MVPPTGPLNLDVEAISGICGSISIACWVVVFSPQIIENFRRSSADGLSLQFIIVWLAGDVFNILGAVLQGVLPTMIILAVYYTIADIVLLGQCFYYRGFTWHDDVVPPKPRARKAQRTAQVADADFFATERTALLSENNNSKNGHLAAPGTENGCSSDAHHHHHRHYSHSERRGSNWSGLSPAVPFVPDLNSVDAIESAVIPTNTSAGAAASSPSAQLAGNTSTFQTVAFNSLAMFMVCTAGVAGWYLSGGSRRSGPSNGDGSGNGNDGGSNGGLVLNFWGQVFGYLCAVLYLGSRLPQLLLNWRRQSTEGVSMLFFLFACLGNLTYVLSIFAYDGCSASSSGVVCTPEDARRLYGRYLLVNLSWLAGSLGTLLLDMGIFIQFFLYRVEGADDSDDDDSDCEATAASQETDREEDEEDDDDRERDERPLLRRNLSEYS